MRKKKTPSAAAVRESRLQDIAEQRRKKHPGGRTFGRVVREQIVEALASAEQTIETLAKAVEVSPRTIYRHLAALTAEGKLRAVQADGGGLTYRLSRSKR